MRELLIPPPEKLVLSTAELEARLISADEFAATFDMDTMHEGAYDKIRRGELVPIASSIPLDYSKHNLVTPAQAREAYRKDPSITVLSAIDWYDTMPI